MAVYDTNLMLRNTTQTVGTLLSAAGVALFTGNWLTLGTKTGALGGVTFRTSVQTAASNTDTLKIAFEFSDDQSTVDQQVIENLTGTMFIGTLGGALYPQVGDVLTRTQTKRTYVRARGSAVGYNANFGVVTIGIDAGETNQAR